MSKGASHSAMSLLFSIVLSLSLLSIVFLGTSRPTHSAMGENGDTRAANDYSRLAFVAPITFTPAFTYYFPIIFNNYIPPVWTSLGLRGLPIKQIAISNHGPETIYAVIDSAQVPTTTALYKSIDSGLSWRPSSDGISGRIQSLFVHPITPTLLLVGALAGGHGVYRSEDGGQHWNGAGLDPFIRVVAAHPTTPTLWLAASYNSLIFGSAYAYRTENAGESWETVIPTTTVVDSFAFDRDDPNRVYACAWSGFLSSQDAGLTWSHGGIDSCGELVTHPYSHTIMYAVSGSGVLETENQGLSWTQILTGEHSYWALALDPTRPAVIYAATLNTLFRSTDAGDSWQQVSRPSNVTFSYIEDLAVSRSGKLYMGTDRGVWSISFH